MSIGNNKSQKALTIHSNEPLKLPNGRLGKLNHGLLSNKKLHGLGKDTAGKSIQDLRQEYNKSAVEILQETPAVKRRGRDSKSTVLSQKRLDTSKSGILEMPPLNKEKLLTLDNTDSNTFENDKISKPHRVESTKISNK